MLRYVTAFSEIIRPRFVFGSSPSVMANILQQVTTFIRNNTFIDNVYQQFKPNGAAAIYFEIGKSRVSSCRFLDNRAGENPYTGVVTISDMARVSFLNSYFENRQTTVRSNQLFVSGKQPLYFVGKNTFNLVALKEGQSVFTRIPTDHEYWVDH